MSQKPLQRPPPPQHQQLPVKPVMVLPPKPNLLSGVVVGSQLQKPPATMMATAKNSKLAATAPASGMSQIKQKIGMNIAELKEAARKAREEAEAETYRMLVVDGGVKRTDQAHSSQSQHNNSQNFASSSNNKSLKGDDHPLTTSSQNNNLSGNNVYPSLIVNFLDNNEVTTINSTTNNNSNNNNYIAEKEEEDVTNIKLTTSHDDSRRRQRTEDDGNTIVAASRTHEKQQDVNQSRLQQKHQYNMLWKDALIGGTYWQEEPWFLPGPTFLPNDVREKLRFPSLQQQQQQQSNNNNNSDNLNNSGPLAVESLIKLQWLEGSALVSLVRVTPNDQVPHHVIGDQLQIEEINLSLFPKIHYDDDEN